MAREVISKAKILPSEKNFIRQASLLVPTISRDTMPARRLERFEIISLAL